MRMASTVRNASTAASVSATWLSFQIQANECPGFWFQNHKKLALACWFCRYKVKGPMTCDKASHVNRMGKNIAPARTTNSSRGVSLLNGKICSTFTFDHSRVFWLLRRSSTNCPALAPSVDVCLETLSHFSTAVTASAWACGELGI